MEAIKARKRLLYIVGLSFIGFIVSVYQSHHFYSLRNGTASIDSLCNLGGTANCDQVIASTYAELVAGFPLSSFAAAWFLAQFILALLGRDLFWLREMKRVLFATTLFALIASAPYLYIMFFKLKTLCLFCLIVDGINFFNFFIALSLKPDWTKPLKVDFLKWQVTGVTLGISLIFCVFGISGVIAPPRISKEIINEYANKIMATPVLPIELSGHEPTQGPTSAKVTIVEFFDFQCPACRLGAGVLRSLEHRYPEKIRIIYRNYPLDPTCNPNMKTQLHPFACEAAKTFLCVHQLKGPTGPWKTFMATLFENQSKIKSGYALELATRFNIDHASLEACIQSEQTLLMLQKDINEAQKLSLKSTPTFFINGHTMQGPHPIEIWDQIMLNHAASSH